MLQGLDIEDENAPKNYSLIYQDRDVVVVEKPSGMLSVPGKTVGKSLLEYLQEDLNGDILPVHRLDMDTSGLMVFARNAETQAELGRQFEERTTGKTYVAVVDGNVEKDSGEICLGIAPDWENRPRQMVSADGRQARTIFKVSRHLSDGRTEVFLKPLTGRTHQLRVHCAHPEGLGHPISGDRLYGSKKTDALLLHATHLEFDLRSERMSFDSPRPSYWPEN
jgi:tRNA pseudouridine32 synthase/23S rRNA pseudouridine746 synthase